MKRKNYIISMFAVGIMEWILFIDMLNRGLEFPHLLIIPLGIIGIVLLFKLPEKERNLDDKRKGGEQ